MRRVIYSLYVDVPAKEHYGQSKNKYDTTEKASITVNAFKKHYDKLIDTKKSYANLIGADFKMFEYDKQYETFEKNFKSDFPELTGYEIINFYKIHLLYELAKNYDEILYLDFDAVPLTKESFFDAWDLSKGICVYSNNDFVNKKRTTNESIRSPSAKYFNCHAMLWATGHNPNNDVINTGIICARKEDILKLDFFGSFKDTIDLMTKLRLVDVNDVLAFLEIYPENIINMFRYDNETIFSYKTKVNKVKIQWLDNKWHYFLDKQGFIPEDVKVVHAINKDFDLVWRRYGEEKIVLENKWHGVEDNNYQKKRKKWVTFDGKDVIKIWKRWYPIEQWFDTYKDYYNFDNRVVKVKEINEDSFKMELLEGDILSHVIIDNLIDRELKLNITTQIMDIVNNMFQFKPKYGSFFWHDDIQLGNFILQPDFKVRLIDPDSFMHVNFDDASHTDFEFGKISNTFHRLKGALAND